MHIHCNTILSSTNTIVYSNIPSSQHSPFRNHLNESTMHSSFTKRFFQRLVERLGLNLQFDFAIPMRPKGASYTLYFLLELLKFYLRNKCAAPTVVSPKNHPIPTFVPLSGIVPDLYIHTAFHIIDKH